MPIPTADIPCIAKSFIATPRPVCPGATVARTVLYTGLNSMPYPA